MHIVVFPGWYPSRVDRLTGDFIQRHMHSIAPYCKVTVVFAVKDTTIRKKDVVTVNNGNLREMYLYYPSFSSFKWIGHLLSFLQYNYYCLRTAVVLHQTEELSMVQLYVLQKNQLLGLVLKGLYKIPYVVSEQSTLYVDGRFDKINWLGKKMIKQVFKNSASFHAVSAYLSEAIKAKIGLTKNGVVIPNVVDKNLFYYNNDQTNDRVTFAHVSNMVYQKNVEGMLLAFAKVKKETINFLLNLVGPMPASIASLIEELGLSENISIWNERNYKEVAEIMQQSDVFVFFTRHETFGCVIIEANACGLPVIVSDLPVTRELIKNGINGVFVESENIQDLVEKILFMINHHQTFDPLGISLQTRNKFNYEQVGRLFYDWFQLVSGVKPS